MSCDVFEGNGAEEARARRAARFLRNYRIQEVIRRRQIMLVQVVKEERGARGELEPEVDRPPRELGLGGAVEGHRRLVEPRSDLRARVRELLTVGLDRREERLEREVALRDHRGRAC